MLDLLSVFNRKLSSEEITQIFDSFEGKASELEESGSWEIVAAARRLWGYFRSPSTSLVIKGLAGAALLYFVVPLDFIPDTTPWIGYVDDFAVMTAALAQIGRSAKTVHDARKYPHLQVVK